MAPTALPTGPWGRVLAVALTAAVLGLAWLAVAAPLLAWHAARTEALAQRGLLAQRMEAATASLPELRRAAALDAAKPSTRTLLDGGNDAIAGAALQGQLEAMATGAGCTLASMETLPGEASGGLRRVGVRLTLAGAWPSLVRLMERIDRSETRMLMDDLQLQVATSLSAGGAQPVAATVTVFAFRAGGPA